MKHYLVLSLCIIFSTHSFAQETWSFSEKQVMSCQAGGSQANVACLENEYRKSDAELNKVYKKLYSSLVSATELVEAESAWVKFRDASCKYELSNVNIQNTTYYFYRYDCLINFTEMRIKDLNRYVEWSTAVSPAKKSNP